MLEPSLDDQEIIARVAALDIGKATLTCCVRVPGERGRRSQEDTTYSTMTRSSQGMAARDEGSRCLFPTGSWTSASPGW